MTDKVGAEHDKLPASMKGDGQKGQNKGEDLLEVKTDKALHGGTNILPEIYSAAVPVETISTPMPGIQTESGTSRLSYGVEVPQEGGTTKSSTDAIKTAGTFGK